MRVTRAALDDLHSKYVEMLRLRVALHAGGEADPVGKRAALARRFPGALREIDELPLAEIRARMAAIDEARADPPLAPTWMAAMARFHALARGALVAKRWLMKRREVDAVVAAAFRAEATDEAREWVDELARVARPPGGRVVALVFERLAGDLGVSPAEARALVFGGSGRRG